MNAVGGPSPISLSFALVFFFVFALLSFAPDAAAAIDERTVDDEKVATQGSPKRDEAKDDHDDDRGLLGPVKVGALASLGFPRPLGVEGVLKLGPYVGLGLEYGVLPKFSVSSVDMRMSAVDVELLVFPSKNGLFLGLAAGRQTLTVDATYTVSSLSLSESLDATTWFVTPRIGFLWTFKYGITAGFDVGAQIPVSSDVSTTLPSEVSSLSAVTDVTHFFGKQIIPSVNLLRLGFVL